MKILVQQKAKAVLHEFTKIELAVPDLGRTFILDLNYTAFLEHSAIPDHEALDFVVFAAIVYAIDKIVPRSSAEDHWTRSFDVTLPVVHHERWSGAKEMLERCVSFLTGDAWSFKFEKATGSFARPRLNRRKRPQGFPPSPVVTLLSGGLDSFVGALDLLHEYKKGKLLFVSHYDGHVSGPASDQNRLRSLLARHFPGQTAHFQVRVGVFEDSSSVAANDDGKAGFETSFRSRSLIFIALAHYAAAKAGPSVPIMIPENGPIALNIPLNPSRRGACSTRTVHPFFLATLNEALQALGSSHPVSNPYEMTTKGEMVKGCAFPEILKASAHYSNSCAKAGRKMHWKNRKAKACGMCVPCIFRRASLHPILADTEVYGNDVLDCNPTEVPDLHALLGMVKQNPTTSQVAKLLFANGSLPLTRLDDYADTVRRMLDEVRVWLADKAPANIAKFASIRRTKG